MLDKLVHARVQQKLDQIMIVGDIPSTPLGDIEHQIGVIVGLLQAEIGQRCAADGNGPLEIFARLLVQCMEANRYTACHGQHGNE